MPRADAEVLVVLAVASIAVDIAIGKEGRRGGGATDVLVGMCDEYVALQFVGVLLTVYHIIKSARLTLHQSARKVGGLPVTVLSWLAVVVQVVQVGKGTHA